MPFCAKHSNQPIKLLCLQKMCYDRLACENCIAENHNRHDVIYISKQIKQFSNLHRNSEKPGAVEKKHELEFYFKELYQKSEQIQMQMKFWREQTANIFFQDFKVLCETFSTEYADWAWEILNSQENLQSGLDKNSCSQKSLKSIDKIANDIRFVSNELFEYPECVLQAAQAIYKQVSQGLQRSRAQINSAMMNLTKLMSTFNFSNIEQVLKNMQQVENTPRQRKRVNAESEWVHIQENETDEQIIRKKRKLCEKFPQKETRKQQFLTPQQEKPINKNMETEKERLLQMHKQQMIKDVFSFMKGQSKQDQKKNTDESPSINEKKVLKNFSVNVEEGQSLDESQNLGIKIVENTNQNLKPKKILENKWAENEDVKIEEEHQNTRNKVYDVILQNNSLVMETKHFKELSESDILKTIQEQINSSSITKFEIKGYNKFSQKCLELLCHKFPNLKKVDYTYNFDEKGLQLQLEQVFPISDHQIRDVSLPMNQETLDIFNKLPMLQNLLIGDITAFNKKLIIKNKNLKHLTIGDYLTSKTVQMPANLSEQITMNFCLDTLNLFNIKALPKDFLSKVLSAHPTLKQLWVSQCNDLQQGFFSNLRNSKISTLILDQLTIQQEITLPQTLENLIVDDCSLFFKIKGINKNKRGFKNFSIFQCLYRGEQQFLGNDIIAELTINSKNTLSYLNLGQNSTLNDESLKFMGEFNELKSLCINKTQIKLSQFIKSKAVQLKKLRRLDVSRLHSCRVKAIQKLGEIFPELINLCISQAKQMSASTFDNFSKLQNLTIFTNQKKKKLENQYMIRKLEQRGIKVNISHNL